LGDGGKLRREGRRCEIERERRQMRRRGTGTENKNKNTSTRVLEDKKGNMASTKT
jgi:molybdopterin/thiamine biosynthesis adenylyltransferase